MNEEKLKEIVKNYQELEAKLIDPAILSDQIKTKEIASQKSDIEDLARLADDYLKTSASLRDNEELIKNSDLELAEMARAENEQLNQKKASLTKDLEIALLPTDPNDKKNVIVEIRPAAGGDESELFGAEILRMYLRYAEKQGWKTELISIQKTGIGGLKYVAFSVSGNKVYSKMKYESGVHRVQRVPETEKQGRVHTSTATVAVMPEAEETDIEIKPEDIRVDVYRSSGCGGQSVNTTDSAVRITHLETNIVVTCQDEKSQLKNKTKALSILRSRLLAAKEEKAQKEKSDLRLSQIGSGDRSEKIRTYNFPQDRLTDHRVNHSWHSLPNIMDGNIDEIITKLISEDRARKLAKSN